MITYTFYLSCENSLKELKISVLPARHWPLAYVKREREREREQREQRKIFEKKN
jgi:hypothetical protein